MKADQFDYQLPPELIAQTPSRRRDQSRLMVLDRSTGERSVMAFRDITQYFHRGDVLVVNNTKVFKARLFGKRKTGGVVEIFLIRPYSSDGKECRVSHSAEGVVRNADLRRDGQNADLRRESGVAWQALVAPSRRVKEGEVIHFGDFRVELLADLEGGKWAVHFRSERERKQVIALFGHVPLPVYMRRDDAPSDIRRYQTVYADSSKEGAVAAPTAGFHFTRGLLDALKKKGVQIAEVTLHVGPGTFKPLKVENIHDHVVDPEIGELPIATAAIINKARHSGHKIFAVGTTTVRTLESAPAGSAVTPFSGMVDLYIKPGHRFRFVDHMVTNFHLPKSSLLILVSAFAGREAILDAYHDAIQRGMRFYSYGDAMLIR
ncbi:MAG: tRNA preQ1(34) S-adenosylmethionine ribosyltransferase-isomerase QueA [Candidatus Zixiibacteriota bacterium]